MALVRIESQKIEEREILPRNTVAAFVNVPLPVSMFIARNAPLPGREYARAAPEMSR
jgi:hypothetical protein